jgi:hypothetical protein
MDQDVLQREHRREQGGDISVESVGQDPGRQTPVVGRQVWPVRALQCPEPVVARCGHAGEGCVDLVGTRKVIIGPGQPVDAVPGIKHQP